MGSNKKTSTTTILLSNVLSKSFSLRTGLSPSKDLDFPDQSKSALKNLLGERLLSGRPPLLKRQRSPLRKSRPMPRKKLLLRRRPVAKRRPPLKRNQLGRAPRRLKSQL